MSWLLFDYSTRGNITNISDIIHNELLRYISKGSGLIYLILINAFFFFILPHLIYPIFVHFSCNDMFYMYVIGSTILHWIFLFLSLLFWNVLYTLKIPYFEKFRITNEPWPWEQNPEDYKRLKKDTYLTVFINNFIIIPLSLCIPILTGSAKFSLKAEDYPSPFEIMWHITCCLIIEDFGFYWLHRLFHTSYLYKAIHKKHHNYKKTVGIAATYAHPIEFFFVDLAPNGIGRRIFGSKMHIITSYMLSVIRILETTDGHGGYEIPWSPFRLLPLSGSATFHDYHHSHNLGNYGGLFSFWDTVCGTNKKYLEYIIKGNKKLR